jgi:hypothetical protein
MFQSSRYDGIEFPDPLPTMIKSNDSRDGSVSVLLTKTTQPQFARKPSRECSSVPPARVSGNLGGP